MNVVKCACAALVLLTGCAEMQTVLSQKPAQGREPVAHVVAARDVSPPRLAWLGRGTDLVGAWSNGGPDGRPDGVFQLAVSIPAGRKVDWIAVSSSDASGNPRGGQVWHSADSAYWILGVVKDGRRLNTGHVPSLGAFAGPVTFELHCADSGYFNAGQWFMVELALGDGSRLRNVVRL